LAVVLLVVCGRFALNELKTGFRSVFLSQITLISQIIFSSLTTSSFARPAKLTIDQIKSRETRKSVESA